MYLAGNYCYRMNAIGPPRVPNARSSKQLIKSYFKGPLFKHLRRCLLTKRRHLCTHRFKCLVKSGVACEVFPFVGIATVIVQLLSPLKVANVAEAIILHRVATEFGGGEGYFVPA